MRRFRTLSVMAGFAVAELAVVYLLGERLSVAGTLGALGALAVIAVWVFRRRILVLQAEMKRLEARGTPTFGDAIALLRQFATDAPPPRPGDAAAKNRAPATTEAKSDC
ncbi:MAG: hypothetical protein FJX56_09425 [Alphaproteobacteria bacterium]|nr:hypothetical protein [Alphaproteobacteria bacterium]